MNVGRPRSILMLQSCDGKLAESIGGHRILRKILTDRMGHRDGREVAGMRLAFADTRDEFNRQLLADGREAKRIEAGAACTLRVVHAE